MLIDTHAHLNDSRYSEEKINEIICGLKANNLEKIICASFDISSSLKAKELSSKFNEIYYAVGVHPFNLENLDENYLSILENLITENSPLIKSVIKRFVNKGIEYDDLYQLGSLGFLKAISNFDKNFNVKFSTYAVPMIAGEVKRFLRDSGVMKISRSVKTLSFKISSYVENYISEYEKSPTIEEVANHFNVDVQDAVIAMESNRKIVSLNTEICDNDGKGMSMEEKIADEDNNYDNFIDNILLYQSIANLTEREKKIIILRYFRDKTQREVATIMGVSQVQISRIENKVMEKLKKEIS